ncbi:hypothetical protein TRVA0_032S00694 [Trichomonascus vanleenenianus]|uniref:uncharacterized protein n=1 Tax=Trichomonascus vanleenenianus TaxID=2268995 RepID=UPI003ECB3EF7
MVRTYLTVEFKACGTLLMDDLGGENVPHDTVVEIKRNSLASINQARHYASITHTRYAIIADGPTALLIDFGPYFESGAVPYVACINCSERRSANSLRKALLKMQLLGLQHCGVLGPNFEVLENHHFRSDEDINRELLRSTPPRTSPSPPPPEEEILLEQQDPEQ